MSNIGEDFVALMSMYSVEKDISDECDKVRIKLLDYISGLRDPKDVEVISETLALIGMLKAVFSTITEGLGKEFGRCIEERLGDTDD